MDDVEDQQLNVLEIIVRQCVDEHIEEDTLCKLNVDPTVVERSIVRHIVEDFTNDDDEELSVQSGSSDGE